MSRTCIICGKHAGSREHIFPASLGGRRTNKGIYCGTHNEGFSPLAKIIADQLKAINALLAVRPDHQDRAEPFHYTSPEGEELVIFDGVVRSGAPGASASDRSHHVRLSLGGPGGLRSIAYIALTFFAHHFRENARDPGLDALKAFVLGNGDNIFAWWESPETAAAMPPNPFAFGHTILVMTSGVSQEATAFVSLFQSFHFGIQLGTLAGLTDMSVIVFVNPQADATPDDIQEQRSGTVLLPLVKPDPMHAYLERNVRERVGEHALHELLAKIERWKFEREMEPVLAKLNAARGQPAGHLVKEITAAIEEQTSRVYRLMRHVGSAFIELQRHNPTALPVVQHLEAITARDPDDPARLAPAAQDVAMRCMLAFINDLSRRLVRREITMDDLWEVFSAGHGQGIVGDILFEPFR
jgi:hypothetical protein